MTDNQRKVERYRTANEQTAELILADPETYPDESLMALWARLVLAQREQWELTA